MKYVVIAQYTDAEVSTKTNDVEIVFLEMFNHRNCDELCVCDGETGEVLFHTGDEPYCTTEFGLMLTGWVSVHEQMLAQEEEDEVTDCDHDEVVCLPGFVPDPDELDTIPGELIPILRAIAEIKGGLPS